MTRLVDWLLALALLAAMSFSVGCGQEPEVLVARHELCAVTLNDDGQVECKCEVVR